MARRCLCIYVPLPLSRVGCSRAVSAGAGSAVEPFAKRATLISVSVRPAQSQIAQGDDLGVEIILTAGVDGAYYPPAPALA